MIHIILSHIEGPINLGLICRTLNNFKFSSLSLINPLCSLSHSDIDKFAPHSKHIIEKIHLYSSVEECKAALNIDILFALSRRTGQFRRKDVELPQIKGFINEKYPSHSLGFVFGNEQVGLSDHEVQICDFLCSIPCTGNLESLNLSHAVNLVAYELSQISFSSQIVLPYDASISQLETLLEELNYFEKEDKRKTFLPYLKKLLIRGINNSEDDLVLANLFQRLRGKAQELKKRK